MAILISDQLDFKPQTIIRDEEGRYVRIKRSVQQEDLTVLNIYAPNMGAVNYISNILKRFYLFDRQRSQIGRDAGRDKEEETGSPLSRKPDAGLDPRTLRS